MTIEAYKGDVAIGSRALEPRGFDEAWRLAQVAAKSGLCGVTTPEAALIIIGTGLELGLTVMQSLRGIFTLDGKPGLYAQTMVAVVRSRGVLKSWDIIERTTRQCIIDVHRVGDAKPVRFEWTIERAAGITFGPKDNKKPLTTKDIWKNDPAGMLYNRCASEACRVMFSDVLLGLYTREELETVETEAVTPPRAASVTVVDAKPSEDAVAMWRGRIESAQSIDALKALREEIPANLRDALRASYNAKKASLDGPKPPPNGGGAPKPEAQAAADANGSGEHTHAGEVVSAQAVLDGWTTHLAGITTPQHVLNSVAAHIDEVPDALRDEALAIAVRRVKSFKWADGKDAESLVRSAIASKVAA